VRTLDHDPRGNLLAIRDGEGLTLQSWTYDELGRQTSASDRFGTTRYLDLEPSGEPRRVLDAAGEEITASYDALGNLLTLTADGESASYSHDPLGRESLATYADFTVRTEYGRSGYPTLLDSSLAEPVTREEDLVGRLTGWRFADGTRQVSWDAAGRVTAQVDEAGEATRFHYDEAGRLERVEVPGTGEVQIERDAAGRVTRLTDALGHSEERSYTPDGRIASVTDALGRVTEVRVTPPGGGTKSRRDAGAPSEAEQVTRYGYDPVGDLVEVVDPVGGTTTIEYDAVHRPVRRVLPNGIETVWSYDLRDRVETASYSWDADGRLAGWQAGGESWSLVHDATDRLLWATNGNGESWSYGYDAEGRRIRMTSEERELRFVVAPAAGDDPLEMVHLAAGSDGEWSG